MKITIFRPHKNNKVFEFGISICADFVVIRFLKYAYRIHMNKSSHSKIKDQSPNKLDKQK